MVALTGRWRRLVMMVMGFRIELPALAAFHDHAMGVMVGDVDQKLGLASAAPVGFVSAAFAHGRASRMFEDVRTGRGFWRNQDHVELGHRAGLMENWERFQAHTAHGRANCQRGIGSAA